MPFEESGSTETTQVIFESSCDVIEKPQPVLIIKNLSGKEYNVPFNSSMTVEELKTKIYEITTFPQQTQRIIYIGRVLEDDRTLGEYKILSTSVVFLVLKLYGGMYRPSSGRLGFDCL